MFGRRSLKRSHLNNENQIVVRDAKVMLKKGEARVAVRRETFEDLTSCDLSYEPAASR